MLRKKRREHFITREAVFKQIGIGWKHSGQEDVPRIWSTVRLLLDAGDLQLAEQLIASQFLAILWERTSLQHSLNGEADCRKRATKKKLKLSSTACALLTFFFRALTDGQSTLRFLLLVVSSAP